MASTENAPTIVCLEEIQADAASQMFQPVFNRPVVDCGIIKTDDNGLDDAKKAFDTIKGDADQIVELFNSIYNTMQDSTWQGMFQEKFLSALSLFSSQLGQLPDMIQGTRNEVFSTADNINFIENRGC